MLTFAAARQKKTLITDRATDDSSLPRLAVVVPAHNEADGIAACINSLQASINKTTNCDVIVIADNCQDATANIANNAGARVLVRQNELDRGKGFALDYAFRLLLAENYAGFLVIDADSRVDEDLIGEFQNAFAQGYDALQCRYRSANPDASLRTRIQRIALLAFNELRLLGRENLNVSVGILGNGFALSRHAIESAPYGASSIAEDMEYHLSLVEAGFQVHFLESTSVYANTPNLQANAKMQRTRWEGGRFRLILQHVPRLMRMVFLGKWNLLEPLAELLLLPLAFHISLLFLALLIPFAALQFYAGAALLLVVAHVLIAIRLGGGGIEDVKALATAPFYILWKLSLLPGVWRNAHQNAAWKRTEREQ